MTGIRLSQKARRKLERELDKAFDHDLCDTLDSGAAPSVLEELSNIGHVPEGSLEEAIWGELGALPPSRHCNARL